MLTSNGPSLALHPQPMVAVHSGSPAITTFETDDLHLFKHTLGIKSLRSISQPDGERISPSRDMLEEVSHRGIHRNSDPKYSSSTKAHPNNNVNSKFHTQNTDQSNAVESVGALNHSDVGNPCTQRGPTVGGMELDEFQEGFCPRL